MEFGICSSASDLRFHSEPSRLPELQSTFRTGSFGPWLHRGNAGDDPALLASSVDAGARTRQAVEATLQAFFGQYGPVEDVYLPRLADGQTPKGRRRRRCSWKLPCWVQGSVLAS